MFIYNSGNKFLDTLEIWDKPKIIAMKYLPEKFLWAESEAHKQMEIVLLQYSAIQRQCKCIRLPKKKVFSASVIHDACH